MERNNREMLEKYQSRAKKVLTHTYVDVVETKGNDIAEKILQTANNENIDTIVVGSRGVRETKVFLLGSVSYKVQSLCSTPSYHCKIDRHSKGHRKWLPGSILHSFSVLDNARSD